MANNLEEETKLRIKNEEEQKLAASKQASKQVEPIKDESKKDEEPSKFRLFFLMIYFFLQAWTSRDDSDTQKNIEVFMSIKEKLFGNRKK